jgi:phosphopantothenoylcysteine decarboxylase/phosphopantothenate--cysteine ligase
MKILLAVTGSISAYKAPDIARGLVNKGHEVKVILSQGALEFLNPKVFTYLGAGYYLPTDDFNSKNIKGVLHIDLSKWCDSFVIAPLSANTLSQLAQGACNDLLSSVFLSLPPEKVKILCPAMNTFMYKNKITKNNLKTLTSLPNLFVIDPDTGLLACGDFGEGKLPNTVGLTELLPIISNKKVNKKVLITAGATLSNIDTVRFVTNPAKGGTAYLIAKKFLSEGYQVHVLQGSDVITDFKYLKKHPNYSNETVITTQDLLESVQKQFKNYDYYISPMAVSDLVFETADQKLKKSSLNGSFKFKEAPDVLRYVVEHKHPTLKIVGFAAESSLAPEVLKEKLARKPVDLLVANLASSGLTKDGKKQGFGTRDGTYKLAYDNTVQSFDHLTKEELATKIFDIITN